MTINFLDDFETERQRRLEGIKTPDKHAYFLWQKAQEKISDQSIKDLLNRALEYANSIDYEHPGLDSEVYAAHPLRVAAMTLLASKKVSAQAGIIALLHNVLELSNQGTDSINNLFGEKVIHALETLTVDRSQQWDHEYKKQYYEKISRGNNTRLVKALDKLDNIFLIHLNPDKEIRRKYLMEIKEFVLPLIEKDHTEIHEYINRLLIQTLEEETRRNEQ